MEHPNDSINQESEQVTPPPTEQPLIDTTWTLTSLNNAEVIPDRTVTLIFGADNSVHGMGGCNNYSSSYKVMEHQLTINMVMSTMMACEEDIMAQEQSYLTALEQTATYQQVGDTLTLFSAEGTQLASFTGQKAVALPGSSWQVVSYNNGHEAIIRVMTDTTLTAMFTAEGKLHGSAGCNKYRASYELDEEGITIGPTMTTRKLCRQPQGIMAQEAQYLVALQSAVTYRVELNNLELRTAEGALAVSFERVSGVSS